MKQFPLLLILLALGLAMPGCMDRTELVDQTNDSEIVAGLDYKDFSEAAENTLRTILQSPRSSARRRLPRPMWSPSAAWLTPPP